jgi:S-adenosyl methyltransferase
MEFFAGCELEEPGLVNLGQWRPDTGTDTRMTGVNMLAGVGRKR